MEETNANGIIRISVTGPESTGKSKLAEGLAQHYNTLWVPEVAREYLTELKGDYTYEDLLIIAKLQYEREKESISKANRILFADTDMLVLKIWSEVKYGKCHELIKDKFYSEKYELYLLCNIDLPWEYDPLREHPDTRSLLMNLYENELISNQLPHVIISGEGEHRLVNAIKAVEKILNEKLPE